MKVTLWIRNGSDVETQEANEHTEARDLVKCPRCNTPHVRGETIVINGRPKALEDWEKDFCYFCVSNGYHYVHRMRGFSTSRSICRERGGSASQADYVDRRRIPAWHRFIPRAERDIKAVLERARALKPTGVITLKDLKFVDDFGILDVFATGNAESESSFRCMARKLAQNRYAEMLEGTRGEIGTELRAKDMTVSCA